MQRNFPKYDIVLSEETLNKIVTYKKEVLSGSTGAGDRLRSALQARQSQNLSTAEFTECLLATKQPKIFAESEIRCDGTDWTHRELALLGDINVTMAVEIYDNGVWDPRDPAFIEYGQQSPLNGRLLFTPGPLLGTSQNFKGQSPDLSEILDPSGRRIDPGKYNSLIERRLLPLLVHTNEQARKEGKPALVVLPGIGCGAFAGPFKGQMGHLLNNALKTVLQKYGEKLDYIDCIRFDPFSECSNEEHDIHGIVYRTRPSSMNPGKPQLSTPQVFQEGQEDFSGMRLYKIVAWDHASLPGNDFFANSRFTDDGVAAAATNSMEIVTGIQSQYSKGFYMPPQGARNWEEVALQHGVRLIATPKNIMIVDKNASYRSLQDYEQKGHSPAPPDIGSP